MVDKHGKESNSRTTDTPKSRGLSQPKRRRDREIAAQHLGWRLGPSNKLCRTNGKQTTKPRNTTAKLCPLRNTKNDNSKTTNLGTTCCCQGTPCVCRMHPTPRILPAQKRHRACKVKERPKTTRLGLSGVSLPILHNEHHNCNDWEINPLGRLEQSGLRPAKQQ